MQDAPTSQISTLSLHDALPILASAGVHSNGFSLVRKCIERAEAAGTVPATLDGKPFKQAIMEPTRLYVKNVDRKSTRLNSSHVKISYAVFCLKKKNTRNVPTT